MSNESTNEYENLKGYFKYLVTLTTIFLGIIGAIASFLIFSDRDSLQTKLTEMKTEYSESIKRTEEIASLEVEKIKLEVRAIAQEEVTKEIDRLFRENKVSNQINSRVKSEIKNNANNLIETRIAESMKSNNQQLDESIKISDAAIKMRIGHRSGLNALNEYSQKSKFLNNRSLAIELKNRIIADYYNMQHADQTKEVPNEKELIHELKHMKIENDSLITLNLIKHINEGTDLNSISRAIYILNLRENTNFKPFEYNLINDWSNSKMIK